MNAARPSRPLEVQSAEEPNWRLPPIYEPALRVSRSRRRVDGCDCRLRLSRRRSCHGWQQKLQDTIPVFGHRNWIVIADSAYPAQSRSAIETVVSGADQIEVVEKALAAVGASKHVRPVIYTDQS